MFMNLSPGAVGVNAGGLENSISVAARAGFGGVEISIHQAADLIDAKGIETVKGMFAGAKIVPGGWGLPNGWRQSEKDWKSDLEALPRLAKAAAALDCRRAATWILPFSNELTFAENRKFHVERFKPIARILDEHGCRVGLEFIGPKTSRTGKAHEFIYRMEDMLQMGREIGPNVGLLLDAWHWYTSHSTIAALKALKADDVVYVHVNDAPAGIPVNEQIDSVRAMPGETGVIDIGGFLRALKEIGYTGPVTAEPFKKELKDLPDDQARLAATIDSLRRIFRTAGLI